MSDYLKWRTLIVDSAVQPVRIASWEKAVRLVYGKKATALTYYKDVFVHSPSTELQLPSVIQLYKHCPYYNRFPKFNRTNVFLRDNYTCQYCGKQFKPHLLTLDHVVPKSQGGRKVWTNIVTSCHSCNQRKSNKTLKQARMVLKKPPAKMKQLPTLALKKNDPEDWRFFFGLVEN